MSTPSVRGLRLALFVAEPSFHYQLESQITSMAVAGAITSAAESAKRTTTAAVQ